ncbi:hypothetical protein M2140_000096 [Clostridiales Family XIII bacterium PM5-7]
MKYYKVKPEYDNKQVFYGEDVEDIWIYIANELYTEEEVQKSNLNKEYMEPVEIPEEDTYWFFGARFGGGYYDVGAKLRI